MGAGRQECVAPGARTIGLGVARPLSWTCFQGWQSVFWGCAGAGVSLFYDSRNSLQQESAANGKPVDLQKSAGSLVFAGAGHTVRFQSLILRG
jgi:hypothetical protein